MGYPVTIFEGAPVAGGMLRLGVPEYRLPRALIQLEINAILSLGVELTTNSRLGHEFTLADLKEQGYAAVFLGVGAMRSRDLAVEGIELDGVLKGIDYLLNVNLGYKVEMGRKVLVIGGGNVALDVARVAARGGEQENLQRNLSVVQALDVARSAIRFGAREVTVCSLESEREMPASPEEIEEASREGITFRHGLGPKRFVGEGGTVTGVEFLSVSRVFDEQGRFSPQFIAGSESVVPADTVIVSIGQTGDFSFLRPEDGIETRGGRIVIDPDTLATTAPGIYAGGDAAFGPRIAINAVADGKRAARSIDERLRGRPRPEFDGTSRSTCTGATSGSSTSRASRARSRPRARSPAASASPRWRNASARPRRGGRARVACAAGPTRPSRRTPTPGPSASSAAAARTSAPRTASRSSRPPSCAPCLPTRGSSLPFSWTGGGRDPS